MTELRRPGSHPGDRLKDGDDRSPNRHPGERANDSGPVGQPLLERLSIHARENWYRDVGLVVLAICFTVMALELRDVARSSSATAEQAKDLAVTVAAQQEEIQRQRADSIRTNCLDEKARNASAREKVDEVLDPQGREIVKDIIDEIVRRDDCEQRVRNAVKPASPEPIPTP